jgi:hypothetical protein
VSLNQREELTEKEDQKSILMIGGIRVFIPSPTEWRLMHRMKVQQRKKDNQQKLSKKEELGKTSGDTPAEGEEDEHSEEWLKDFSKVAEKKTPVALKLTRRRA